MMFNDGLHTITTVYQVWIAYPTKDKGKQLLFGRFEKDREYQHKAAATRRANSLAKNLSSRTRVEIRIIQRFTPV